MRVDAQSIAKTFAAHRTRVLAAFLVLSTVVALVQIPRLQAERTRWQSQALALQATATQIATLRTRAAERQAQGIGSAPNAQALAAAISAAQFEAGQDAALRLTLPPHSAAAQLAPTLSAIAQHSSAQVRRLEWSAAGGARIELAEPVR